MARIVYVSYTYSDARLMEAVVGWQGAGELGPDVVVTYEPPNIRPADPAAQFPGPTANLRNADIVLCPCGPDTWQYCFVNDEIQWASQAKPILGMKRRSMYRLPLEVTLATEAGRGLPVAGWSAEALRNAIEAAR